MKTLKDGPHLILVKKSGKCRKNTEIQKNSTTRKNTSESQEEKY